MNNRTWNIKLMATDDHPEQTIEGVSHADATKILRELMHGPVSFDRAHAETAVHAAGAVAADGRERPLAA